MCGRSSLDKNEKEIEARFGASFYTDELFRYNQLPNYNVAPSHYHPVLCSSERESIRFFRWGLVPSWAKDEKIGFKMINARKETLMEKPSFKNLLQSKRCIVPFDGFYEWKKVDSGKIPYRVQTTDQDIFTVAGLWTSWTSPEGKVLNTFTLITQEPNSLLREIHDRMPAILLKEQEEIWLDENIPPADAIQMLIPYPEEHMHAYTVSKRVGNVRENDKELLKEVKYETEPPKTLFD